MTYFDHLNYTIGDEDARVEAALVPEGGSVASIAGCGSRLIPLLARRPSRLVLYDTGESQLHLTALRLAALRAFTRDTFVAFFGYHDRMAPEERRRLFGTLELEPAVRDGLGSLFERARWARIATLGRFERMIGQLATVNRLVTGASGRGLFETRTLDDQRRYLGERFPRRRFDLVVAILGNSTVLNTLLYRGEFPAKNVPGSARSVYARIFERLFTEDLARRSFFLQLAFYGDLPFEEGYPVECDPAVYDAARAALEHTRV